MTLPRRVVAGAVHFVTRRCSLRRFFLPPTEEVHHLLLYTAARAAQLFGIELHAFAFVVNHVHFLLTDREGNLPAFMRWFGHNVACALNRRYGHTGLDTIWEKQRTYTRIRLYDADVIEQKLLYTLMNPIAAGLVPTASDWWGGVSLPEHFGRRRWIERPRGYYRQKGRRAQPERVELRLTRPALLRERYPSDRRYRESFAKQLAHAERETQRLFAAQGRRFLGLAAARRRSPHAQPRDWSESKTAPLRWPFQTSDPALREWLEQDHVQWLSENHDAHVLWARPATRAQAVFPHGSYQWVRHYGAPCAPPRDPDP